ncbi:unnamed protein product [Durusdinium trenchii]|uniref:Uncharacterized protein n=2 Tax=Durusdinium trenchii TaxID=1381693 RepID=A0ABP0S6X8_9DINO
MIWLMVGSVWCWESEDCMDEAPLLFWPIFVSSIFAGLRVLSNTTRAFLFALLAQRGLLKVKLMVEAAFGASFS